jgi:hypothetical protein
LGLIGFVVALKELRDHQMLTPVEWLVTVLVAGGVVAVSQLPAAVDNWQSRSAMGDLERARLEVGASPGAVSDAVGRRYLQNFYKERRPLLVLFGIGAILGALVIRGDRSFGLFLVLGGGSAVAVPALLLFVVPRVWKPRTVRPKHVPALVGLSVLSAAIVRVVAGDSSPAPKRPSSPPD